MGTQEEEAKALAELERVRTENAIKEMERQAELKKLQEQQGQNRMVAAEPVVANWPDDGFQAAPGRMDAAKAALGIGAAGDAAFAKRLLEGERRAPGAAGEAGPGRPGGTKERLVGALSPRPARTALER
jgi:hypothetical protein